MLCYVRLGYASKGILVCSYLNNLLHYARLCDSLEQFKRLLKTHLFGV